ncbi:alpha-glucuronidase [Alkalibacterium putridalgicola]|uniref:Alpha-glucuronidase n=1 Tax=Alkalibacterium putridalgicola TaxID=426703 RepID=A0A1H7R8M8_9LACT|nr:alpha-glucuronidase [Alkalibacterium putridalgicola]GEK88854.1 xylan alpha-1,2-glucuronidase [Alkalibacterium putridalgicola]SEL56601.1 alpha-glucuronidase [Alkalibacterium putridalgicola]
MTTKLDFDLSWLAPETLKAWPFGELKTENAAHLKETLVKEFDYYSEPFPEGDKALRLIVEDTPEVTLDGYKVLEDKDTVKVTANQPEGLIYGFFHIVRSYQQSEQPELSTLSNPKNKIRMINHWDNFDGSVERGYAGKSLFFVNNEFRLQDERFNQYAKMLSSVGINALTINNVNVHQKESYFITDSYIREVKHLAEIFRSYGLTLFLSVNYAAPIEVDWVDSADPLDDKVREFWKNTAELIYEHIPYFGGFVVKADSENRPGPFTYGRTHADGANMLGEALKPFGGTVFWRAFVYDNHQDWRDKKTDRARAAYDHYAPMDGDFADNVVLQIKNGPMDFQVREAVSPLFGSLRKTNQVLEFQIAQEYTGQQKHICYLIPMWKEVLDFDTYADGPDTTVQDMLVKYPENPERNGITAVVNTGMDENWTGHKLAQANLYGYGRLIWDPSLSAEEIAKEWIQATYSLSDKGRETLLDMLMTSWDTYEKYTSPLGIGWMVQPNHHYGPNIDGYEYDMWGTYHYSDRDGLGVDRTVATGTGYTRQYHGENYEMYENVESTPEELLLFFHHMPYSHELKTGKTIIQHIYDTHFEGFDKVLEYQKQWESLEKEVDDASYQNVKERLEEQHRCAREWRDQVNTYYYRKSGVDDAKGRKIYK